MRRVYIEQNKLSILITDILVMHTAHSFIAEALQTQVTHR